MTLSEEAFRQIVKQKLGDKFDFANPTTAALVDAIAAIVPYLQANAQVAGGVTGASQTGGAVTGSVVEGRIL